MTDSSRPSSARTHRVWAQGGHGSILTSPPKSSGGSNASIPPRRTAPIRAVLGGDERGEQAGAGQGVDELLRVAAVEIGLAPVLVGNCAHSARVRARRLSRSVSVKIAPSSSGAVVGRV